MAFVQVKVMCMAIRCVLFVSVELVAKMHLFTHTVLTYTVRDKWLLVNRLSLRSSGRDAEAEGVLSLRQRG